MVIFRSVAAVLIAAALALSARAAEPLQPAASASASADPSMLHHRGMPGEKSPHNGWADYGRLTLDVGTDRFFVYEQGTSEFAATVVERATDTVKIRGISMPGAGIFYYPPESSPCAPDALERVGLYAEQLLFYLSSAFPAGPSSIGASATGTVERDVPDLHFMGAVMKAHGSGRTELTATRLPSGAIEYLLKDDKDKVKGAWEPRRNPGVAVADSELLLTWKVCWAGSWVSRMDGGSRFAPRLANAADLKTFGDVRKAVRTSERKKAAK